MWWVFENIQLFVCHASALSLHIFFLCLCFNFSSFGCWRLLAALRKSWSSWRRRTLMWQFQMMRAVLCAIMYIIILSVLRNRRVTNLYLSMCLYFQESMKKPRCVLWPPFWKLLHLHVIDMSAYLSISCLFFFFWCMWIICVNTNLVVKHLPVWTLWSAVCSFVVLPIQSKSSICKIQVYVMSRNCWPISQSLSFFFSPEFYCVMY